jgi:hypothetical protein
MNVSVGIGLNVGIRIGRYSDAKAFWTVPYLRHAALLLHSTVNARTWKYHSAFPKFIFIALKVTFNVLYHAA